MALYSFSHSKIGAAETGKCLARLAYICRSGAVVFGERHDLEVYDRPSLRGFAQSREALAGKNGRVAECFIAALPCEGTPEQHRRIVSTFCNRLTRDQAPWIAAIHYDKPGNPHAHILAFDQAQAVALGRGRPPKVMALSRDGALEDARALWAECHNAIMAGLAAPIDHRSLAEQGKPHLLPGIHEGPAVRAMKDKGVIPQPTPKTGKWVETVDWPRIDEGRDRMGVNADIARINQLSTAYTEAQNGRPDGVSFTLAGKDGPIPYPRPNGLASNPGNREPHRRTAGRDAEDAGRSRQVFAASFAPDSLSARLAAWLCLGLGRVGRRARRRGVASVGRYASVRLRRVETALRRLIDAARGLSQGIGSALGLRPALSSSQPFQPPPNARQPRQRER